MQEGTKASEKRRRIKARSRQSVSDISSDGSPYWNEVEDSENESEYRPRSKRDLYSANQPKSGITRSISHDTGMETSDDLELIAHGHTNLQSTVETNSSESYGSSSINDKPSKKKKSFFNLNLKKNSEKFVDKVKKVSNLNVCIPHYHDMNFLNHH